MRLSLGSPGDLVKELPWTGGLVIALLAALVFEHFVVHVLVVLPAYRVTGEVPLWNVAAMVVPELMVFFAFGQRLRTALPAVMDAGVGALVRSGFHRALAVTGQPGHTDPRLLSASELALGTPVMALAYLLVLALAAAAAAEQRRPAAGG